MPQQWNFWGFPVTIRGQTDRYWGDLPNTFDIRFAPTDTWAFTMLQTMRVWEQHDSGTAFAQLSFTDYDFIDENWVPRTNDVSAPDNTWNKTAYIAEYGMTAVRVERLNRNVSASPPTGSPTTARSRSTTTRMSRSSPSTASSR